MNLLSPAICETKEGDILIVWGGRRIVTTMLVPPLKEVEMLIRQGVDVEQVWKRRYRWDSGPLIVTKLWGDEKRTDYNAIGLGRNPAIIKDLTGRIWIGYRIPVISAQDPMGALSANYVVPKNIGTTAGMNFWQVLNADNLALLKAPFPFDWQEQVAIPVGALSLSGLPVDFETLDMLMEARGEGEGFAGLGDETLDMFTDWTLDRLTGGLTLRGMGGNVMDENKKRWRWNESEGLGRGFTSCIIDHFGRQVRLAGNQVIVSLSNRWDDGQKVVMITSKNYGLSGCVREDSNGQYWVAGYNEQFGEIPWQVENEQGMQTEIMPDQKAAEKLWAEDNEQKWVLENARVPGEGYFSYDTPPTPQQQEALARTLRQYYYALPTIERQRAGFCISSTGLIFIAWVHGNLTAMPIDEGKKQYKAVGLRVAVSKDSGRSFEPFIPQRQGFLQGVN